MIWHLCMPKQQKIPIEVVKHFPPKLLLKLINRAKQYLKDDEVMQKVFAEYDLPIEYLNFVPMTFADLDVSAKTVKGVIYLNYKLLCDGDFFRDYAYLLHETVHFLQQISGDGPTKGSDDGEYLDNEYEIESFQNQVEWIANELGEHEAEKYVDHLLDHHEIEDEEAEEKKDELMTLV
jgi:hypothetical protein